MRPLLLAWLTVALMAFGLRAEALTPEQAAKIAAGDSDDRIAALNAAVAAGDAGLVPFVQAMLADEVKVAGGKAYVISSSSGFVYVYDMSSLKPAGRIRIGTNIALETATTDTQDRKIYLAESTNHEVVIIDSKDNSLERVKNVGLFPWGTHIMDSKDNYCH